MAQVHSLEQVTDGVIHLLKKNVGARTILTADANTGDQVLTVENTFHFKDAESIALIDVIDGHIEWHSILQKTSTTSVTLVNPLESNYTVANQATIQKAIGGVPLAEDDVLLGDREVIPNPDVTITVDPINMNNIEWVYLRGGLSMQHNIIITIYVKLDQIDNALRTTLKYGDYIFNLFVNNVHMDVVNDETFLTANVAAGATEIPIADTTGWPVDLSDRYEVQDNNNADIDFNIVNVLAGPPRLVLERPVAYTFRTADKALFRRRVRYIYNSLVTEVEYGYIQKGSQMYKASRVTWWGKEAVEIPFPQTTSGGIT